MQTLTLSKENLKNTIFSILAELNSTSDRIEFIEANAFDYMHSIRDHRFDLIILPPHRSANQIRCPAGRQRL